MKKKWFKIVAYCLIAVLVFFILANIFSNMVFQDNVTLETAEDYTYSECIDFSGIAVRDETLLYSDGAHGSVMYLQQDGHRVAKDSIVAFYTKQSVNAEGMDRLVYLNDKIDVLEQIVSSNVQSTTVVLEQQVQSNIIDYLNECDGRDVLSVGEELSALEISLSKKDVKMNGTSQYSQLLTQLQDEKKEILATNKDQEYSVTAPIAGYFYSGFDGYESLTFADVEALTPEKLEQMLQMQAQPVSDSYIGKLQDTPVWYFCGLFDSDGISDLKENNQVALKFDLNDGSVRNISATIYSISEDADGKCAVVFECSLLTEKEFSLRKESCSLVRKTYTGIKVSNNALRVVDGQNGVYVLVGKKVTFKPVDIVYSSDTFSIVKSNAQVTSRILTANDEVVCGGKDMFDGKVLNVQ